MLVNLGKVLVESVLGVKSLKMAAFSVGLLGAPKGPESYSSHK